MDMFWIESHLIDKVGTKNGYSWDHKWTMFICRMQLYRHFVKNIFQFPIGNIISYCRSLS